MRGRANAARSIAGRAMARATAARPARSIAALRLCTRLASSRAIAAGRRLRSGGGTATVHYVEGTLEQALDAVGILPRRGAGRTPSAEVGVLPAP